MKYFILASIISLSFPAGVMAEDESLQKLESIIAVQQAQIKRLEKKLTDLEDGVKTADSKLSADLNAVKSKALAIEKNLNSYKAHVGAMIRPEGINTCIYSKAGHKFCMQSDTNAVVSKAGGGAIWDSSNSRRSYEKTSYISKDSSAMCLDSGRYSFCIQADDNVVLYQREGKGRKVVWARR